MRNKTLMLIGATSDAVLGAIGLCIERPGAALFLFGLALALIYQFDLQDKEAKS